MRPRTYMSYMQKQFYVLQRKIFQTLKSPNPSVEDVLFQLLDS